MLDFEKNEHTLKVFDLELAKLRHRVIKMGTLVQQQIEFAMNSLFDNNLKLAEIVTDLERKVDKLDIKIDKQCMKIFALHQPVAMDLRLVLSSVSINDYFEIIGDLASEIAMNVKISDVDMLLLNTTKIKESSELVNSSFAYIMDNLMLLDSQNSDELIEQEAKMKAMHQLTLARLREAMKENPEKIDNACLLMDVSKNLTFISSQIRTIAQELIFLFEAKIVKHTQGEIQTSNPEDLLNDEKID